MNITERLDNLQESFKEASFKNLKKESFKERALSIWNPINDKIKELKQAIKAKNNVLAKNIAKRIAQDFAAGINWDKEISGRK